MAAPPASANSPQVQAEINMLLNGPAGKPPIGMVPNFQHPPNLDAVFIATTTLCATVAALAVVIRLYTKQFLMRSRACEDYILVTALIGELSFIATSTYILKSGGGIHMWDLRLKDFFRVLYWLNISSIIYGIVIFLIKLSILLQYIRIFVPTRKGNMALFVTIHIVIWSLFIFYLANTIFEIALCQPREKIWNLLITSGHCFDINAPPMATGIFNVLSDFAILVLPIAPIWKLQMAVKKKIMVAAIFATGIVACATSILRTVYTWKIVQTPDVSYNIFRMGLWTVAEMAIGILVSCLPVMPRFFQHFGLKISSTLSHGSQILSKLGQKSGSKNVTNHTVCPLWFKRSGTMKGGGSGGSETLVGEHEYQAEGQRKYIMLEGFELAKLRNKELPELPDVLAYGRATRREDIETGAFAA